MHLISTKCPKGASSLGICKQILAAIREFQNEDGEIIFNEVVEESEDSVTGASTTITTLYDASGNVSSSQEVEETTNSVTNSITTSIIKVPAI